jgi:hypothetical protein
VRSLCKKTIAGSNVEMFDVQNWRNLKH